MQGIVIETREVSPNRFRAEVVEGPWWSRGVGSVTRQNRHSAYFELRDAISSQTRGKVAFIHVPE